MRNFELETYFSKWEFSARYHMTASDLESMSMAELLAMSSFEDQESFQNLWLGYTETYGLPALREEIAKTYEMATMENILCFSGAEEGVYTAMRVLLTPQDHAVVVVPNYQAAETIPLEICEVSGVPLDSEDNWQLDIDAVKREVRPNTKLISINFPNNPTGAILERSRFDALIDLCRENGIYLFSDEVYRLIEREPSLRLPNVGDAYEKGLSLNVMSKAYGLPGLRIGWIMCQDKELLHKMECYKHYLTICSSAPSEHLALMALKSKEKILARNRALVRENVEKLEIFFKEFPDRFEWKQSDGGCVGFPRYLGPGSTDDFCEALVEKSGVLLLPPKLYHSELLPTPKDRFRIGFGRKGIEEGLAAFKDFLNHNES